MNSNLKIGKNINRKNQRNGLIITIKLITRNVILC